MAGNVGPVLLYNKEMHFLTNNRVKKRLRKSFQRTHRRSQSTNSKMNNTYSHDKLGLIKLCNVMSLGQLLKC